VSLPTPTCRHNHASRLVLEHTFLDMLDPLTALGLAGNLIQVIQFSYDIVSEGNKIYNDSGSVLGQNKTAEEVATDLSELTQNLKAKQEEWRVAHGRTSLEPDETRLRNLCDRCVEVAYELQIQLNKLKAKDGRGKRLKSYKQALISVWRKDDIEEIAARLKRYQQELDTRVLLGIRQSLQEADVRNADQFTTLDQRTKALTIAVLDHNGNFDTKLDQHTDLLVQIAAGQIKTHEMLQAVAGVARTPSPAPPAYHQVMHTILAENSGPSPLHLASENGHTTQLRQLLRNPSIDVNARDEHGCTPLHVAANADVARYLLRDKRIGYDAEDNTGRSALHYAVLKRRLDVVKVLLSNNVDKELEDDLGKTALFYAQDCQAATFMLRYGAEVEATTVYHKSTGLTHTAWLGDREGVEFYMGEGASINAMNSVGDTALTSSAQHGNAQIVEMLLKGGADTEIAVGGEWTALLQAIRYRREDVARVLLRHGAKKRAKLKSGNNTLAEACWRKQFGIARLLIEAGSSIDTRDLQKATPLFKAAYEGDVDFVRWALQAKADVHAKNDASLTPLYVACERGHSEVATLLLDAGGHHQTKTPAGWTPMAMAASRGRNKCVKALLQHGADPNLKAHYDNTPVAEACYHGHPKMLRDFIAAGADTEATNRTGFTPLAMAAARGQDECVRVLVVDAGAKLEARGSMHKKPK
jgi:ankyrin repeat protein